MEKKLRIGKRLTVYGMYEKLGKLIEEGYGNRVLEFDETYWVSDVELSEVTDSEVTIY